MRVYNSSQYGLPLVAALVLTAALSLWVARRNRPELTQAQPELAQPKLTQAQQHHQDQRVLSLLERTVKADNTLTYSAVSTVTATYGQHEIAATARVVRAPKKLSITYQDGDNKGLKSGYNENWFWRQDSGNSPLRAYAEVAYPPYKMATDRFKLTTKNYRGRVLETEKVNGLTAHVVELRPRWPVKGASGPKKRLWIDQKSGLTLRVDSFNYQARPVMRSILSKVVFNPNVKDAFVPPARMHTAAAVTPWMAMEMGAQIKRVVEKTGIYPPKPNYIPPGFEFDSVGVHHCNDMGEMVDAALTRYSDGINVLTIFAMRPNVEREASGSSHDNNANGSGAQGSSKRQSCDFGMGTMAMRDLPKGRLVAVADLPPQTMDQIIDSTTITFAAPRGSKPNATTSKGNKQ